MDKRKLTNRFQNLKISERKNNLIQKRRFKIRLCILNHFGFSLYDKSSQVRFGGAEVQLYLLAKYLGKKDLFKVNLITGEYRVKKRILVSENQEIYVFLPIKRNIKNIFKFFGNLFTALIRIDPDVIIHRTSGILVLIFAIYSKLFGKKFIFSIASEKDVKKEYLNNISGKLYKIGLKFVDVIIAQNENQVKELHRVNPKLNNIKLIKSGQEILTYKDKQKKFIMWVGSCISIKRPELFLKLARDFPEEKFVIICPKYQSSSQNHKWREIQKGSQEIPNLRYIKHVPFEKIDYYFKRSKIFVNTSIYEGFPNTFIQALKFGTPIVSLKINPDNFLTKNKCGFYCDNDFSRMKGAISKLLENKELYQTYSQNAFKYVKRHHNIQKIGRKWEKSILNLIRKG